MLPTLRISNSNKITKTSSYSLQFYVSQNYQSIFHWTSFLTNWHRLVSAQFHIIYFIEWNMKFSFSSSSYTSYTHWFSLIGAKILNKINMLTMKKFDNFVSNCSRYIVQPFVLEVLMSSFEKYPSWIITIPRGYLPPGGSETP